MKNNQYPVRPESSPKVAPVKKKDIHASLQEANESAEKLNEQRTELGTKFATMQKAGVTSRLDAHAVELFNNVLAQTNAMPGKVEKAVNKVMDKAIKQIDEKISEIKMICIAITIFLNGLQAMVFFLLK